MTKRKLLSASVVLLALAVLPASAIIIVDEPDINVSPLEYNFGDVVLGSSATMTVTISNVGQEALVVSEIGLEFGGGTDFSIVSVPELPVELAYLDSVTVEIAYTPSAAGPASVVLGIANDDPDESLVEVALSGTGVGPASPATASPDHRRGHIVPRRGRCSGDTGGDWSLARSCPSETQGLQKHA